jgi:dUTP pyrophosphatase
MAFMDSHKSYEIKQGDRLFQLVLPNMQPITKIIITDELSNTSRGTGGFGSTGK